MIELLQTIIPYKVLASHVLLVFLVAALIFKQSLGRGAVSFLGKWAIQLSFLVAFGAIIGSLFYSEVVGFEACVLCWWQRVFLYPQAILFAIAWWKKDGGVFKYAVPLTLISLIIGLYQAYANMTGFSLLPCTALEGGCSKIYVEAFGYITIPVMAVTVALYLLLIAWARKIYENRNA